MMDTSIRTMNGMARRTFMKFGSLAVGASLMTPSILLAQTTAPDSLDARTRSRNLIDKGPPTDENMVFDFVHKSHFDFNVVQKLLSEEPQLVHASWDWGGGDFETGIGAASHMGRRDIALYLIGHGARTNLFAATMLGHLDIVRGFLEHYPDMINCKGPHGLSLMHHADKGGEQAAEVLAYLKSKES